MSQRFVELAFTVPLASGEEWTERLVAAGAGGVEERDAATLEKAPEGKLVLVAWIAPDEVDAFLARAIDEREERPLVRRRDRDEDEWRDAWKKHFGIRRVGCFVIVPSWERYLGPPEDLVLDLDPGRAFGTGGHASTRLCLEVLSEPALRCRNFLDVGCGSGVLAIACARRFSEADGIGIDVDEDAVEVARENATRNRVGDRILFSAAPLERVSGLFDVITANIQPEVLIPMAGLLAERLAPQGRMILSGILVEAADAVEAAYRAAGLTLVLQRDEAGAPTGRAEGPVDIWRALVLERS